MGFAPTQDGQAPEAFLARAMASGDAASANGVRVMLQQSTADNGVWGTYVPVDADAPI
jgi:hypothetical protein